MGREPECRRIERRVGGNRRRAVPAAHGNDGGGSIRIPAACCGIVGLKPARGRVPLGPDHGTVLLGLVAEHALTRTVRDSAAILDATQGASPGDPYVIAPPARPFSEEIGAPTGRLKIAYTNKAWTGVSIDPETAAAVDGTAKLCSELGHDVTKDAPVIDADAFGLATQNIWCSFIALGIEALAAATERKPRPESLEASSLACFEYGKSLTTVDLYRAEDVMNRASADVQQSGPDGFLIPSHGPHAANPVRPDHRRSSLTSVSVSVQRG